MRARLLLIAFTMSGSLGSFAASQAQSDRGASCTDYCTEKGKKVLSEQKLLADKKVSDEMRLGACGGDKPYTTQPGNVHWCQVNCLQEGGLLSKIKGRQGKVEDFVSDRLNKVCPLVLKLVAAPN